MICTLLSKFIYNHRLQSYIPIPIMNMTFNEDRDGNYGIISCYLADMYNQIPDIDTIR